MKKLFIIYFLLCAKSVFAQTDTVGLNVPFINNTVVYEKVLNVKNASKSLLYSNAALWFAETHPYGGNTQLTLRDSVLSRVLGRVTYSTSVVISKVLWQTVYGNINYNFTLQIDCKDDKYRVRIYNIQYLFDSYSAPIDDMMQSLISSKTYTLSNGAVLNTNNLKLRFQALNSVVGSVISDVGKGMTQDNGF